ncbi:MAG: hypothetical protein R2939_06420 [Kofleriaceae bacterium]
MIRPGSIATVALVLALGGVARAQVAPDLVAPIVPDAALPAASDPAPPSAPDAGLPGVPDAAVPGAPDAAPAPPAVVDAPYLLGQPEVTASAAPAQVRLGEPFTLYITAVHGADVTVNLPSTLALGDVLEEAPGRSSRDTVRADGKRVREWQVPVRAWALGELQLPPVPVTFVTPGGSGQVATGSIPVEVVAIVADADDPNAVRGLAPPRPLSRRDWTLVIIGAAVLGLALAAVIAMVVIRRRRRRRVRRVTGAGPAMTWRAVRTLDGPTAEALRALAAIEASGTIIDAPDGAIADAIVVVRTFVARRGGFAVDDLTTGELLAAAARTQAVPTTARAQAVRWFDAADRSKFGGAAVTAEEAAATVADARALVLATAGVDVDDVGEVVGG